jgi:hypothetical protein
MAMRTIEIDEIGNAIDSTNKEIFGEAFEQEELTLDETGDRTVEQMGEGLEGQHEPDDDDEAEGEESEGDEESDGEEGEDDGKVLKTEGEDKPEAQANGKTEPKVEGRVPSGTYRQVAERARAAEAERDSLKAQIEKGGETKALSDKLELALRQIDELRRQPVQQQQPKVEPKVEAPPDLFENPTGFVDHLQKGFQTELSKRDQQLSNMRLETSFAIAHAFHKDTFEKAFDSINKLDPRNPDDRATVQRIASAPNPGEALVNWHRRSETLRVVGDDPTKFLESERAKMREELLKDPEFRKQIIDAARSEAGTANNGAPNTTTRLPRSLNQAEGGNRRPAVDPRQFDDSDTAVFSSAFASR